MKRLTSFAFVAVIGLYANSAGPALSQERSDTRHLNPMVNTNNLARPGFYTAPRQYSIEDERPILTDHRRPDRQVRSLDGSHVTGLPPVGESESENGIAGNSLPVRFSNPMTPSAQGLPEAEFESHLPAHSTTPREGLPDGTKTGGLRQAMSGHLKPGAPDSFGGPLPKRSQRANPLRAQSEPAAPAPVAMQPRVQGVGAGGSLSADTSVRGVIFNRAVQKLQNCTNYGLSPGD